MSSKCPHTVLAVDPGKNACGVAFFVDGVLARCGFPEGTGPFETAWAVSTWHGASAVDTLVIENQQIYGGRIKTDPNDLLPLAQVVGGVFARIRHTTRANPLPREWKGSVAKAVFTARIRAGLSVAEVCLVSNLRLPKRQEHNVLDAIGLGKWWLSRV